MKLKHAFIVCTFTAFLSGCYAAVEEPGYAYVNPSYGESVLVGADVYRGDDGVWRDRQHHYEVRQLSHDERAHWAENHHGGDAHASYHAPEGHAEEPAGR